MFSDTDAIISAFLSSFDQLKSDFRAGIDIATVVAVLEIQQTLSELKETLGFVS
jgi:hypothetical protein